MRSEMPRVTNWPLATRLHCRRVMRLSSRCTAVSKQRGTTVSASARSYPRYSWVTARRRLKREASGGAGAPLALGALLLDEVDEHVAAERVGRGEEGAAAVELGQALDEVPQVAVGVEHERVDADLLPRAAGDRLQRGVDRPLDRRVVEGH